MEGYPSAVRKGRKFFLQQVNIAVTWIRFVRDISRFFSSLLKINAKRSSTVLQKYLLLPRPSFKR